MSEIGRRFSLDKVAIDPELLNKIFSADGDDHIGDWDGECIDDLVKEIDRIEERRDPNYSSLPHSYNIPEDFKPEVGKDYPIWTCDKKGRCLVGDTGSEIMTIDEIRDHYIKEYGSIEQFKEKLKIEREKFVQDIKNKSK
ncbi:MAG: hypothetical protein HN472_08740 [Nitrospina sp.]|jgi:hypothetical protein|nr:hypothetical protein [Nitrospina sp.]MBT3875601.1 hypothetical protein [Nitrospina sp.]MBT4047586.1 hypothetical protein [Nitrospina sp.]MBT4556210.1 hypothetical protein [Nitrospina sp.]MBT5348587.1 hypothetical protein [Nitrospina sp.]